jgi:hypothetical protein
MRTNWLFQNGKIDTVYLDTQTKLGRSAFDSIWQTLLRKAYQ